MPGWKKWLIGVGALIVLAAIFSQSTNTVANDAIKEAGGTVDQQEDSTIGTEAECAALVPVDADDFSAEFDRCVADPDTYVADTETETASPPVADPSGDYTHTCDVLIPDGIYEPYPFIATAKLKNTGNVGLIMVVTAWAEQTGAARLKWTEKVKLPVSGRERVNFNADLTEDQSDRYFAGNLNCGVKAKYVDTFGTPVEIAD